MKAECEHKYFDSNGVRLHYLEAGSGTPVLMMHGFSGNADRQFGQSGVIRALATRYRVLAIDGRGHGLSEKPHDPTVYGPEMGQDLLRLQDHIGVTQSHMIGYSLGAMVLAHLVCHRPERFLSCVLGGATGRFNWSDEKQRQLELEASELAQGSQRSQILRLWPDKSTPPDEVSIAERSRRSLEGQDVRALAASRLGGGRLTVRPEDMQAITVPVLGVVGDRDPYSNDFYELEKIMPQLRVRRIAGADHSTTTLRREFSTEILRFLETL
jgi:pimeloyl-ACP methyl ester carboxylesterase